MNKNRICLLIPIFVLLPMLLTACFGSTDSPVTSGTPLPLESDHIAITTEAPDLHREELNAILNRSTMLEGVTIAGVNVGGMTVAEVREAVGTALETQKKAYTVSVTIGEETVPFSGESIPMADNLEDAIGEAFNLVREDKGFDAVSAEVEAIRRDGMEIPVTLTFDEASLKTAVEAFANEHDVAPVNASVAYNKEENKIDFTPDVKGVSVDRDALLTALLEAKDGDSMQAPIVETEAEETLESIQSHFVVRGTQTTNYAYSGSTKNRRKNIEKGAKMLTGTIMHPGDELSMNKILGVRNKANGWYLAGAYQAGDTVQEYGGGVCQISTTLYNAALKADMNITSRRNHSMPVHYISMGLDATINSVGNIIDFKFKNSSKADIIIIATTDGKNLTVEIWGIPIIEDSEGKYDEIRIPETKKLKTLQPTGEKEVIVDATKPVGYRQEDKKRREGSIWQSYIEYYLNGQLIENGRKELATSTYKAYSGSIIVGPDATPAPDTPAPATPEPGGNETPIPTPTKEPDPTPTKEPDPTKQPDPTQEGGGE